MMADYNGSGVVVDPMCGSGTLLIEAALMALKIAPGAMRKSFAFQRLNGFKKEEYQKRHDEIWPELVELLKQTGISEYSIF